MIFTLLLATNVATQAQVLVSQNLGSSAYRASGDWRGLTPELAFDGEARKQLPYWNSGAHPLQWIEVDLGESYSIVQVKLVVEQLPTQASSTAHEVWVSHRPMREDLSEATLAFTFTGATRDGDWLDHELTAPVLARYVQVRTIQSPSWVAWREIQVFAAVPL